MQLLLDTQIAIWWQIAPQKISQEMQDLIGQRADAAWISRASLWEMAIKIGLGKLHINLAAFIRQVESDGFRLLPIIDDHMLTLASLRPVTITRIHSIVCWSHRVSANH